MGGKLVLFRTGSEGSWKKAVCFKVCKGAGPKAFESGVEGEKDFEKAGKGGRVLIQGRTGSLCSEARCGCKPLVSQALVKEREEQRML